ncbi:rhoptry neck protein 2 [Babesia ovis]|uniref:Rhoptry neck protein 2 n=1 Tax=Babesia ovis TaxID=5869 RepID=A0A9W5TCD4_BABOV|nr:rhoptry neck protein 2 [Babesia ovis]
MRTRVGYTQMFAVTLAAITLVINNGVYVCTALKNVPLLAPDPSAIAKLRFLDALKQPAHVDKPLPSNPAKVNEKAETQDDVQQENLDQSDIPADELALPDSEPWQDLTDAPLQEHAAATNTENLAALENSISYEGFLQPFIQSLNDEFRTILLNRRTSNFVGTYMQYALKLSAAEKQTYKRMVKLVEENADAIGFVDFSEKQRGNLMPEVNKDALKAAGVASLLQLGEEVSAIPVQRQYNVKTANPRQVITRQVNPRQVITGQVNPRQVITRQVNPRQVNQGHPGVRVIQTNKPQNQTTTKPTPWKRNPAVLETLLTKVLLILGGDAETDTYKRLVNMATVLGFDIGDREDKKASQRKTIAMNLGMEMFWVSGNNPFLLGHLATNMLAYTQYNLFFAASNGRPFYTWLDLINGGNLDMLDRMCGTKRGPKYKRGSDGSVTVNKRRRRKDDPDLDPDGVFLCNLLEILLISIDASIDDMGQLLSQHGVPYEHHIGPVANGRRMQTVLCSNPKDPAISVRCDFMSSTLNSTKLFEGKAKDEGNELWLRLREAFDFFKLLSDVNLDGEQRTTWMQMISDPRKYSSVFEYTIKYDNRMFSGKRRTWVSSYKKVEKKITPGLDLLNLDLHTALSMLNNGDPSKLHSKQNHPLKRALIYMSASGIKPWVVGNLENLQQRFGFPPSALLIGNLAPYFRQVAYSASAGLGHILLYHMLTSFNPAYELITDISGFKGGNLLYNIAESSNMFIPASLKRGIKWLLKGGLAREFRREKAKHTLLKLLPVELLRKAISSITFVTHSLADIQINQNAEIWGRGLLSDKDRMKKHFTSGGYVNHVDSVIKDWSDEGYSEAIAKKVKQGEDLNKEDLDKANMHNIVHTESLKWEKHLNSIILEGYNSFLDLPSIKILEGKHSLIYEIVKDSRDNLEQHLNDTIFFGRVVNPPVYNNKWKRALQRAAKLYKTIFNRSFQNVEHAVWFGVKLNYQHIVEVVEELHKISNTVSSTESYNLQEAFGHIIDDAVSVISNEEFRRPASIQENVGIPGINPLYVRMSPDERKVELQQGMCGQHCGAIWRALLGFTMNALRSPASIKTFEKSLSQDKSLKDMEKPEFVNSLRFILQGDAMLHMYDSMLPKKMKRDLRAIKYGKAFYFANVMKMASTLLGLVGFRYTSNLLRIQAPYFGNMIVRWDREREKSKSKAIFSYLSIGTMATYSIMQCAEITQHAIDIGAGPTQSCFMMVKPPALHCVLQPAEAIMRSALAIGVQDTLAVTVLSLIGPYFFIPMAAYLSWNILKHHFKVLHRLDIAMSNTFKRMWSKISSLSVTKKLTDWFNRRRDYRKEIESKGLLALKNRKQESADMVNGDVAVADELLKDDDNFSYTTFN